MKYCKHLKKRKNKPYCNIIRKEITLSQCRECVDKEYRVPVKGKIENSKKMKINNKKCTIFVKNRSFLRQNAQNNQKIVQNSLQNSAKALQMKNKSNKLAKLERKRFSVFTSYDKCFICDSTYQLTWNEIYRGKNRINSMKYGFCLRMCLNCHREYQEDAVFNELWHKTAQRYFEEHYGTRDEFIAIFRRNYLE